MAQALTAPVSLTDSPSLPKPPAPAGRQALGAETGFLQLKIRPAASRGERDGLDVWAEQGCGSCHTLAAANAHGFVGPDLASSLKGVPTSYIKESIVAPSKAAAAGYSVGAMPEDYASRINPEDLDRLVSFLRASARR